MCRKWRHSLASNWVFADHFNLHTIVSLSHKFINKRLSQCWNYDELKVQPFTAHETYFSMDLFLREFKNFLVHMLCFYVRLIILFSYAAAPLLCSFSFTAPSSPLDCLIDWLIDLRYYKLNDNSTPLHWRRCIYARRSWCSSMFATRAPPSWKCTSRMWSSTRTTLHNLSSGSATSGEFVAAVFLSGITTSKSNETIWDDVSSSETGGS